MTAAHEFWTKRAEAAALDPNGLRNVVNTIVIAAQLWTKLVGIAHGDPLGARPFMFNRDWRVVVNPWPDATTAHRPDADSGHRPVGAAASDAAPKSGSHGKADPRSRPPLTKDPKVVAAAVLLGVAVTANADEIRAALRTKTASQGAHPDQGGDLERAKQIIAAKNLLIERARKVQS